MKNAQVSDVPHEVVAMEDIGVMERRIQGRLCGRVLGFRLTRNARGLILQGQAPSYHAKQLAQHAVMQATLVPILANQIEVRRDRGELVSV
jgi:hypothetical protein